MKINIDIGGYCIRNYRRKDVASICRHADNPKVSANLRNRFPHPYTMKDAEKWVDYVLRQKKKTDFAISDDSGLIGGIGLEFPDDVHGLSAGLGYWLGELYWGRGIMTRAVTAFCDYAFQAYDLVRIFAYVFETNSASARVLEKSGFTREGVLRKSVFKRGQILDQFLYAKLYEK